MGGKHDRSGRTSDPKPRFVKLHYALLDTPAYQSLSVGARALLVEVYKRWTGFNNGTITFSEREAIVALGMSDRNAVRRYFAELIDRGFLRRRVKGGFGNKVRIASQWIIEEHEYAGKAGTRAYLQWRPKLDLRDAKTSQTGVDFTPAGLVSDPTMWDVGEGCQTSSPR